MSITIMLCDDILWYSRITELMKVAYVGDFINHGKSLQTTGTSIVILLSMMNEVDNIDVYCPVQNSSVEDFTLPAKVKLIPLYKYDDPLSILHLLSIKKENYDRIIFNLLSTGFGNGNISNLFGLLIPYTLKMLFKLQNIRVVYHNSVFTNDIEKLGYNSPFDKFRAFILGFIEKRLFKNLETFVLLDLYKERITSKIGLNKVTVMKGTYLEAVTSVYINGKMTEELHHVENDSPVILMHGFWGPQKNLELGLKALHKLKLSGKKFKLIISGGINHHFPYYEKRFNELIRQYSDIISAYMGCTKEKDIMDQFLNADLIVLPYNTPGGHSAVLEQALFFEVPTLAMDFPEYEEQTCSFTFVKLCSAEKFESCIEELLLLVGSNKMFSAQLKIIKAQNNVQLLLF